jgi:hypothetical protein
MTKGTYYALMAEAWIASVIAFHSSLAKTYDEMAAAMTPAEEDDPNVQQFQRILKDMNTAKEEAIKAVKAAKDAPDDVVATTEAAKIKLL